MNEKTHRTQKKTYYVNLHKVQNEIKLIYGKRFWNSGYFRRGVLTEKGHEEAFWGLMWKVGTAHFREEDQWAPDYVKLS